MHYDKVELGVDPDVDRKIYKEILRKAKDRDSFLKVMGYELVKENNWKRDYRLKEPSKYARLFLNPKVMPERVSVVAKSIVPSGDDYHTIFYIAGDDGILEAVYYALHFKALGAYFFNEVAELLERLLKRIH